MNLDSPSLLFSPRRARGCTCSLPLAKVLPRGARARSSVLTWPPAPPHLATLLLHRRPWPFSFVEHSAERQLGHAAHRFRSSRIHAFLAPHTVFSLRKVPARLVRHRAHLVPAGALHRPLRERYISTSAPSTCFGFPLRRTLVLFPSAPTCPRTLSRAPSLLAPRCSAGFPSRSKTSQRAPFPLLPATVCRADGVRTQLHRLPGPVRPPRAARPLASRRQGNAPCRPRSASRRPRRAPRDLCHPHGRGDRARVRGPPYRRAGWPLHLLAHDPLPLRRPADVQLDTQVLLYLGLIPLASTLLALVHYHVDRTWVPSPSAPRRKTGLNRLLQLLNLALVAAIVLAIVLASKISDALGDPGEVGQLKTYRCAWSSPSLSVLRSSKH